MTKLERAKVIGWVFLINFALSILFSVISKHSFQAGASPPEIFDLAPAVTGCFGAILYGLLIFWPRIDPRSEALRDSQNEPPKAPPSFSLEEHFPKSPTPAEEADIAPEVLGNIHQRGRLVVASLLLHCFLATLYHLLFKVVFNPQTRTISDYQDYIHQEAHASGFVALIVYLVGMLLFVGLLLWEPKISRFLLDFVRWVFFSRRSKTI